MDILSSYKECRLCARGCGVDRAAGNVGYCRSSSVMRISRAALHMWEEPIISGECGSGTIFFSGCSLGCIYCQNREISRGGKGQQVSVSRLSEIMLELQAQGAHNINFVTPTHFAPSVASATEEARGAGLLIPTVYNTGSFDTVDTVKMLEKTVDIYLPDFKYYREKTGRIYSSAELYPSVAFNAISEMVRQKPEPIISQNLMRSGVIIRLLLLPGHVAEAKLALRKLFDAFGNKVYFSLMSQYTPMSGMEPPLDRCVTSAEYAELVKYAERIGVVNGFTQEGSAATESFIPSFDME